MKNFIYVPLLIVTLSVSAQKPVSEDDSKVKATLNAYKTAIEKLDTAGTGRLFFSKSQVVESGGMEGSYQEYKAHHLAPELTEFKSFTFGDYKVSVVVDLPYAFATETYKYTIVVKKDNSTIVRKGIATTVLKKDKGDWKIWQTHTSSRRP